MSSKPPTTGKDPKIPQKEVMVTRHKSSQMKRQLRPKDRSMKHITDLLKSPTRETQPGKTVPVKKKSPKAKQSLLKSVEKIQNLPQKTFKLSKVLRKEILLVQEEEYHPNKRKRKLNVNKVILKAKPSMKVVGEMTGSVKRKYAVPLKVSNKPTPAHQTTPTESAKSTECVKLSMAEAIQLMDEQLTDEDLMEILTCPSPVWWEDPPDEHYIEDALFTRSPGPRTPVSEKTGPSPTPVPMEVDSGIVKSNDKILPIPNLSSKSEKFMKKRSKLEDLLGNIKDKSNNVKDKSINNKQNSGNKTETADNVDAVLIRLNNPVYNEKEVENVAKNTTDMNEIKDKIKNSDTNEINKIGDKNNDKLEAKLSESDDEIILHNSSMNEDELLMDLENMDIPIGNDVIVIDDDDDLLDKPTREETNRESKITNNETVISEFKVNQITDKKITENTLNEEIASPKSLDSSSSKSSSQSSITSSSKDIDTISDTNVRFLLEDEEDSKNKMTSLVPNKCIKKESTDSDTQVLDDNVTVYKIIEEMPDTTDVTNSESNEKVTIENINSIVDAKLNDYFKKCKKVYQKRLKNDKNDINKNGMTEREDYLTMSCDKCKPTFKKVSENENVKYCLKCSSIFDSKDCTYCIKKTNRTCVPCKIKFCCESYFKTHTNCGHDYSEKSDNLDAKIRVLS